MLDEFVNLGVGLEYQLARLIVGYGYGVLIVILLAAIGIVRQWRKM